MTPQRSQKTLGITILVLIKLVVDRLYVVVGLALLAGVWRPIVWEAFPSAGSAGDSWVVVVAVGLLDLALGWGLWNGKAWAWLLMVIRF